MTLVIAPALAQAPSQLSVAEGARVAKRAQKAYKAGEYAEAVSLYQAAYRVDPRAAYLFAIGVAAEKADQLTLARDTLERFLAVAPADERAARAKADLERISVLIEARRPTLTIDSEPAGAKVFVDERAVGTTPYHDRIDPGPRRILLRLEGYEDDRFPLALKPAGSHRENRLLKAKPVPGAAPPSKPALVLYSKPPGAEVFLDGATKSLGQTPYKGDASPGPHTVSLRLVGYCEHGFDIDVVEGAAARHVRELTALGACEVPPAPQSGGLTGWAWGSAAGGALGVGLGVTFLLLASDAEETRSDCLKEGATCDLDTVNAASADHSDFQKVAFVSFGVGAALALTSALLFAWPEEPAVAARPGGLHFRW